MTFSASPRYKISIANNSPSESIEFVENQLLEFNFSQIGSYEYKPLVIFLRDAQSQTASKENIVGGFYGFIGLGWLNVSTLWVTKYLRGQGYGQAILTTAEQEAIRQRCNYAYVFTYSFQAPNFYQKLGYEIFAVLDDFPPGYQRFFLKKQLV